MKKKIKNYYRNHYVAHCFQKRNLRFHSIVIQCVYRFNFYLFQNAGVHLFTFVVLLIGSGVLLECTTTGSGIVSAIRKSMTGLMMRPFSESATTTLNMIQESVSRICP